MIRQIIYTISFSGFFCSVAAQSVNTSTSAVWAGYFFSVPVSEKWKISGDMQLRSKYGFSQLSQMLIRSGIAYSITPTWTITTGAAYFKSAGQLHLENIYLDEYRLWQENAFQIPINHFTLTNRTRLEERWLQKKAVDGTQSFVYASRLRNKMAVAFPVSPIYVVEIGTECMLVANKTNVVDVLRIFSGIYYMHHKTLSCQLQYMYQCQYKSVGALDYRDNQHIIRFNIYHEFHSKP
ncbi:MAG: DUF2490 domain-containing protein [Hydrotalea sp. AMD]|nr:DUF2490 domain-containing protein [Hydrotalea lipotrueae]RWZ89577.1 MAG: DUF2490 domain-containing protein [Hydrotalea sp. AMD]